MISIFQDTTSQRLRSVQGVQVVCGRSEQSQSAIIFNLLAGTLTIGNVRALILRDTKRQRFDQRDPLAIDMTLAINVTLAVAAE